MSDLNSSLPVRTEANGDIVAQLVDGTITSQKLAIDAAGAVTAKIEASNGDALTATGSSLNVNVTNPISTGTADQSTFTYGTSAEQPIGGVYQDTGTTLTAGQTGAIRSTAERALHINIRDAAGTELGATAATGIFVKPTDGTNSQAYTAAGEATVSITQPLPAGTAVIGQVTANAGTDLNTSALALDTTVAALQVAQGSTTAGEKGTLTLGAVTTAAPTYTTAQSSPLSLTTAGALRVDASGTTQPVSGTVAVSNLPSTVDTDYGAVGASTIRTASQIGNATGAADFNAGATGAQTLRVEANQGAANATPWNENIAQIAGAIPAATNALPSQLTDGTAFYDARQIRALTAADVVTANIKDSAGAAFGPANPLPVYFAQEPSNVVDPKDASAISSGSSDDHDYIVTAAKTFYLKQIEATASGKAKVIVSVETGAATGTFTPLFYLFNSTASPNMALRIDNPISVAAGVRVRVTMTNREANAEDLYSTILGYEV